jgi:hypothetical protein
MQLMSREINSLIASIRNRAEENELARESRVKQRNPRIEVQCPHGSNPEGFAKLQITDGPHQIFFQHGGDSVKINHQNKL